MKKSILNIGKTLSKSEQKSIKGSNTEHYPICKCDTIGRVINQPCDGYGPGCGIIDIILPDNEDLCEPLCK
ncbi:hypothetical protein [uncultured Tenacibaculum sp.]|uniref:hypothetical protein n=1 Tax=uncultured Tenacibaculum sp. TaxID=174713 RepID=UPI00262B9A4D|nr:hypothetical protein [uncultured Tenacibaculum sp.]